MNDTIRSMTREIDDALDHGLHSLWLYGSLVLDDFRLGWSDIDCIAFAQEPITEEQATRLLNLRQDRSARCPENPYYRCFEGVIVSLREYLAGQYTRLVYWGTSGQRITDRFRLDPFSRWELVRYGKQVYGAPAEGLFMEPTRAELIDAVRQHCEGIRRYAVETDERLYSCGWLLDMARCMYTLRYGGVISKTRAGAWALEEHLFPEEAALQKTLLIRKDPLAYRDRPEIRSWLRSLGPTVQRYADVLEKELQKTIEKRRATMVIGIIGENCTGKSTLAEEIQKRLGGEIVTGKDYLRLAKSESIAAALFKRKLSGAVAGEDILYVISEPEQVKLLPEGAVRILVKADLEDIKERFKARVRGNLPAPVAEMLERKHGCFDDGAYAYTFDSSHDDMAAFCDKLMADLRP